MLKPLHSLLQHQGCRADRDCCILFFLSDVRTILSVEEKKTEHSHLDTCIGWIFHAKERFREAFYGGVATILQAHAETRRLTWRHQDNVGTLSHTPAYRVE